MMDFSCQLVVSYSSSWLIIIDIMRIAFIAFNLLCQQVVVIVNFVRVTFVGSVFIVEVIALLHLLDFIPVHLLEVLILVT